MRKGVSCALMVLSLLAPRVAPSNVTQDWVSRSGAIGGAFAAALATDVAGNVYVAGYTCYWSDPETGDCFSAIFITVKFDMTGRLVWSSYYTGPAFPLDYYKAAITLDAAGNVYVTGVSASTPDYYVDYITRKIDPAGTALWASRYHTAHSSAPEGIAVDGAGNVYVTGSSSVSPLGPDYATIKYDAAGHELWVARYDGGANDFAHALSLDAAGNVYVTGGSQVAGLNSDFATVKYDTDGNQIWVATYDGPASGRDQAVALVLDSTGNICVTGSSAGIGTGSMDYATIKYDTDGNQLWVARYDGPASAFDEAVAIGVDGTDNIYVTGSSAGVGTSLDYATIKYDSAGNQVWASRYNGPGNRNDSATAMVVDTAGNAYVTGSSVGIGTDYDYSTVKYDATGAEIWVARYNGPGNGSDVPRAITIGVPSGGQRQVYVTGTSWDEDFLLREVWLTIQYTDSSIEWLSPK